MTGATPQADTDLTNVLGHTFNDPTILTQALTHPSIIGTGAVTAEQAYERLEFLGDRVLGLVVAELLLEAFPTEREGDIAKRHSMLVRRETLAEVAAGIDLGHHIQATPGEVNDGVVVNQAILSDACEAVIAALYLDGGLEAARQFITRYWRDQVLAAEQPPQDAKTELQELMQSKGQPLPQYRLADRQGPDHAPVFTIEVTVKGQAPVSATGPSKQKAEQAAAGAMLKEIEQSS
ncbi:MAG: ribonuclease III [Alphaproteobacteria bacterium]|nr:ribonuclease III [Alphaproteobacteria bacterium SS10]